MWLPSNQKSLLSKYGFLADNFFSYNNLYSCECNKLSHFYLWPIKLYLNYTVHTNVVGSKENTKSYFWWERPSL